MCVKLRGTFRKIYNNYNADVPQACSDLYLGRPTFAEFGDDIQRKRPFCTHEVDHYSNVKNQSIPPLPRYPDTVEFSFANAASAYRAASTS